MKKFLLLFLLFVSSSVLAQVSVKDDAGQIISLKKPAKRIISLAPNLTEILYAIGAGKNVVGVSVASDYPLAATKLPIVASASEINLEVILELHPDLVVVWLGGNPINEIETLKKMGIAVYSARIQQISDIKHTMQNLAQLTGHQNFAKSIIDQLDKQFQQLKQKYLKSQKITVFYQIWQEPLFTVNHDSMINQVITLCGGQNIYANTVGLAPQVSIESVLARNPQVIVTSENNPNWQMLWMQWPKLSAVMNKNLFYIPADLIERPGPRLIEGASMMCEDLAKVRYKALNSKK